MKIYTQILLGMAAGALVGVTLGPTSALLERDVYEIEDASHIELRVQRDDDSTRLVLPLDIELTLRVAATQIEEVTDRRGETVQVPTWVRVRLRYDRALALRDKDETLRKQLGNPAPGGEVDVWLRIEHKLLDNGGVVTSPTPTSGLGHTIIGVLRPVGTAFMRLIKMVIVPLVFSSLLVGVASLGDLRKLGRLGGRTLALYLVTTALAVIIGLAVAHVINPGSFVDKASRAALQAQYLGAAGARVEQAAEAPSTIENVLAIIPENPASALVQGDMLQIIFFAIFFGVALTMMGSARGEPVVTFFDRVQHAMIVVIHLVMKIAPFGVLALVADVVGTSGLSVLRALLVYGVTVLVGLLLHVGIVYSGLVRAVAGVSLSAFYRAIRPAQLIAFSTSSSSATLPVSLECAEENLGVSNTVASFVLPLGSTVNMDGTALYQGVAALFIAQVFQMDLSWGTQLGIVLTATLASIGAAGVPGAGMVTLAMVLTAAGIPTVGVALILGIDRLLDMFRTVVNVTGDLAVSTVMAVGEGETLTALRRRR